MSLLPDYRAELEAALVALSRSGQLRRLQEPRGIDLASNDYLGLAGHPQLVAAMLAALEQQRLAGSGGSRLLLGNQPVFGALEERLAAFCGAEAALLFGSGYLANLGLLPALLSSADLVLSDAGNHASLIDGIRLSGARKVVYPHQDLDAVAAILRSPRPRRTFVVTESVFSMDGDLTPLTELAGLAERHEALLIVDEAHATGLYGARGSGRVEELGLRERVLATVHTGGKALGSAGAWVAGPAPLRELLLNRARSFVFSTAPLPVLAAALHAALDLVEGEPRRRAEVQRKAALLRGALAAAGVACGPGGSAILPVIAGGNEAALRLQEGLRAAGFDARAVRPPTVPAGTARLRVTVRYPVADAELLGFAAELGRLLPRLEPAAARSL